MHSAPKSDTIYELNLSEELPMDELKAIFASNLIKLRTGAGLTQAELGEMLHYSDKSVSKWERAEAIPDAFVLKAIA